MVQNVDSCSWVLDDFACDQLVACWLKWFYHKPVGPLPRLVILHWPRLHSVDYLKCLKDLWWWTWVNHTAATFVIGYRPSDSSRSASDSIFDVRLEQGRSTLSSKQFGTKTRIKTVPYQLLTEYRDPDCPRLPCSFRQMTVADWLSDFAF